MLGFVARNLKHCPRALKEKAYLSYVRPKLEYCASIWDPHQDVHINRLEMVQHRAARFVSNTPHKFSAQQTSITKVVKRLGWPQLTERRRFSRLQLMYKVTNNLVEVPLRYHPTLRNPQPARGNQRQFNRPQPVVDAYKYSFVPRTITDWNDLDSDTVTAASFDSFKKKTPI